MDETTQNPSNAAADPQEGPRIVVGVDGSDPSLDALRQAARFAQALGARIDAVTTWDYPVSMGTMPIPQGQDFGQLAHELMDHALEDAFGDDRPASLDASVVYGHPAQVLIERSEGAEMLIVGSRGRGGFRGLLLGSVSSEVSTHAKCPVLIVR